MYVLIIQDIQQTRNTEYKTMDPVWEEAIHSYMAVTQMYELFTMVTCNSQLHGSNTSVRAIHHGNVKLEVEVLAHPV